MCSLNPTGASCFYASKGWHSHGHRFTLELTLWSISIVGTRATRNTGDRDTKWTNREDETVETSATHNTGDRDTLLTNRADETVETSATTRRLISKPIIKEKILLLIDQVPLIFSVAD